MIACLPSLLGPTEEEEEEEDCEGGFALAC